MRNEGEYKAYLTKLIETEILPGSRVIRLSPEYYQGIPDLIVLYGKRWGMLEAKRSNKDSHRPNQDLWVNAFNNMSFASFIYPEIESEVLYELQQALIT